MKNKLFKQLLKSIDQAKAIIKNKKLRKVRAKSKSKVTRKAAKKAARTIKTKRKGGRLKVKPKKVFIHMIRGNPAQYYKGQQICFGDRRYGIKTVDTLEQIRKEQRASHKWRRDAGFDVDESDYDYMRIIK